MGFLNLGTGKARRYKDLAEALFMAVERKPKIDIFPTPQFIRVSYQYFTEADMTKLKNVGCDLFTTLKMVLKTTCATI